MSTERIEAIQSAVNGLIRVLSTCTQEQFAERVDLVVQLCQIWSNGEDVDLRCNEPEMDQTSEVDKPECSESQSVQVLCVPRTKPIAKYKAPVFPRRKPGQIPVPFDCTVCGKSFQFHSQLEQHSRYHSGVRPYECAVCGQSFALQCSLLKHATIHTGEKPLMCDTCGQRFAHANYLKAHQKTHLRDQPYSCQECDRKFTTAGRLRHHISTSHCVVEKNSETHDRFTCDKCGLTFASMTLVRCHLLTHADDDAVESIDNGTLSAWGENVNDLEGNACNICGKKFNGEDKLRRHMVVIHFDSEKPHDHVCHVCGRRFFQLINLKVHMTAHSFNDDVMPTRDSVMSTTIVMSNDMNNDDSVKSEYS